MKLPNPLPFLHAANTNPPALEFILPGFIPGTVAGLVSPGGTGKSFFALELACAVAGGQDANLLKLPVIGQGPVLYLAAEDPPEILHKRLHHIARYMPEPVIESGGRGPSLSPTPLGTARASFPAGGSGHSKPWLMSHSRSSHPREVWVPERIDQSALSAFRALDASFLAAR
uniref:AAA domain-containing protein n=1 Tax=Leptospirillum ferriphilum TaxID=178606 RepID=A0A7C3QV63_9BACT